MFKKNITGHYISPRSCCPSAPRYVSPTCDSTHVCTPGKGSTDTGLSTVRRKAGCVLRISYSYIIDNGMDEIANKSHNTFCVTVFYVKRKNAKTEFVSHAVFQKNLLQPKRRSCVMMICMGCIGWISWEIILCSVYLFAWCGWNWIWLQVVFLNKENIKPEALRKRKRVKEYQFRKKTNPLQMLNTYIKEK